MSSTNVNTSRISEHLKVLSLHAMCAHFQQEAEKGGIKILGFEGTEEKANFDSILTPIVSANPDLIYFGGNYPEGAMLIRQIKERKLAAAFLPEGQAEPPRRGPGQCGVCPKGGRSLPEGDQTPVHQ